MDNDTVEDELRERIQELEDELQKLKDKKRQDGTDSQAVDEEIEEVHDQIRDEADHSGMSRRKFMKAIAGGGAALGAAAMMPSAAALDIESDNPLSYNDNFSVDTQGNLNLQGNKITNAGSVGAETVSAGRVQIDSATTVNVPADYNTIAEAVNDAPIPGANGFTTITVDDSTRTVDLNINRNNVKVQIKAADPANPPTLNADVDRAIRVGDCIVVLQDFTINGDVTVRDGGTLVASGIDGSTTSGNEALDVGGDSSYLGDSSNSWVVGSSAPRAVEVNDSFARILGSLTGGTSEALRFIEDSGGFVAGATLDPEPGTNRCFRLRNTSTVKITETTFNTASSAVETSGTSVCQFRGDGAGNTINTDQKFAFVSGVNVVLVDFRGFDHQHRPKVCVRVWWVPERRRARNGRDGATRPWRS